MASIKSIFVAGITDKESDPALIEQGFNRGTECMRFHSNGGNDGIGVNIKGTLEVADETAIYEGDDEDTAFKCVGGVFNEDNSTIYYLLASSSGIISKICSYNILTKESSIISHDNQSKYNFSIDKYITGINEIDGLLFISEWEKNPRRINIERAKTYGLNGFTEEDIQVVLIPPHQKPKITLQSTGSEKENNIEEKLLYFAYQWRYLDGDYSIVSPFSEAGFFPSNFDYDYATQSNRAMVNNFNQIKIEFDTGNERVAEIRLIFKESQSNTEWIIDDFNKEKLGYGHNETREFLFDNNKAHRVLSDDVIRNFGNTVPLSVKTQTIIDGRLLYANYKEFYDLLDSDEEKINIDYNLELESIKNQIIGEPSGISSHILLNAIHSTAPDSLTLIITTSGLSDVDLLVNDPLTIGNGENAGAYTIISKTNNSLVLEKNNEPFPVFNGEEDNIILFLIYENLEATLIPKKTVKSYRDYEVGIVYLDSPCRTTPVLVSKTNTLFIPNINCVSENSIHVILKNKPPAWAKYYRFFIKQSKKNYDTILPLIYYTDGVYRWVKLEGADKDKVKEGDYLIVKADSNGILETPAKIKVLEIKEQEANFISTDNEGEIGEKAGLYFKIISEGFRIEETDLIRYSLRCSDALYLNSIFDSAPYISDPHFYGTGVNDMSSSGTYSGANEERHRFIVEIDSELGGSGGVDTFRWSNDNGGTWTNDVDITGGSISLSNGVQISFSSTTGHSLNDQWAVNARAIWSINFIDRRPYGYFRTVNEHDDLLENIEDEIIYAGARIKLTYNESGGAGESFEIDEISTAQYDNIQEWFYKENIISLIISQSDLELENIRFMRGVLIERESEGNRTVIQQNDTEGTMTMCVKSKNHEFAPLVESYSEIIQNDNQENLLILETEPVEQPVGIYHEIGKTYDIVDNYHISDSDVDGDVDQSLGVDLRVKLDFFNAFCFGNAIESYKIKDEFNRKGTDVGIRTSTVIKDEYKQIHRKSDITWSDVYEKELSFNGLSSFNFGLSNFVKMDQEEGAISRIHNANGNLLVFQENDIGILPYNKSVIYDVEGDKRVGISTNILDKKSFRSYANGKFGTKHPESFVSWGNRKYIVDQARGVLLRISNDGVTPLSDYLGSNWFSKVMDKNQGKHIIGGYEPTTEEYLLNLIIPSDSSILKTTKESSKTLAFKDKNNGKGFSTVYPYTPDFIIHADNKMFSWHKGVMYQHNVSLTRNNFYGKQYLTKIKFYANKEASIVKIWQAMSIESNEPWDVSIKTKLTSRKIDKLSFEKIEDYWYSIIKGNTNGNLKAESTFGLGTLAIVNGLITVDTKLFASLSVGDHVTTPPASNINVPLTKVIEITPTTIKLETALNTNATFLLYKKNQDIDGASIRGDVLEVEMTNRSTKKVELRAVNFEVLKSETS